VSWLDRAAELGLSGLKEVLPTVGAGIAAPFHGMGMAENFGKGVTGTALYGIAKADQAIGSDPYDRRTINAYEQGYNGYSGGRGPWEQMVSNDPRWAKIPLDVFNPGNPLNILMMPVVEPKINMLTRQGLPYLAKTAEEMGNPLWNRAMYKGLEGAGRLLDVGVMKPQQGLGYATERIGGAPFRFVGKYVKPGKAAEFITSQEAVADAYHELRSSRIGNGISKVMGTPVADENDSVTHQIVTTRAQRAFAKLKSVWGWNNQRIGIVPQFTQPEDVAKWGGPAFNDTRHADIGEFTNQHLDDMADYAAYVVEEQFKAFSDKPFGAINFAMKGGQEANKALRQMWGQAYEPIWDAAFRRAAELHPNAPAMGAKWTNAGALPFFKTGPISQLIGRGPEKPGYMDAAATQAASVAGLLRREGSAESFLPSNNPIGPVPPGGRGELYTRELQNAPNSTKAMEVSTPQAFKDILNNDTVGPHGLQFGEKLPDGTWVPAKQSVRTYMENGFGMKFRDEDWDHVWDRSTEVLYHSYLTAAQESSTTLANEARMVHAGLTREERLAASPTTGKRSIYAGGPSGEIDPTEIANIVNLPGGADYADRVQVSRNMYKEPAWKSRILKGVMRENQKGTLLPDLHTFTDHYVKGNLIDLSPGKTYDQWYKDAAEEMVNLFGKGNIADAIFFADLVAATSSGTAVKLNVENALYALSRYKMGDASYLKNALGFTDEQVAEIPRIIQDQQDEAFESQYKMIQAAKDRYSSKEFSLNKGGGPKTGDYGNSFDYEVNRKAIMDNPQIESDLKEYIVKAMDDATSFLASDRHNARLWGFRDTMTPEEYMFTRFGGNYAAEQLKVPTSRMQAAQWGRVKQLLGVSRSETVDSVAEVLKDMRLKLGRQLGKQDGATIHDMIRDTLIRRAYGRGAPGIGPMTPVRRKDMINHIYESVIKHMDDYDSEGNVVQRVNKKGKVINDYRDANGDPIPKRDGATFDILDPQRATDENMHPTTGLRENQDETGYMVGLTGTTFKTTDAPGAIKKEIGRLLTKYKPAFEGIYGDELKIGVWNDKGEVAVDLVARVEDEQRALAMGSGLNQKSIYNIATGELLDTGGDGVSRIANSKQLNQILAHEFSLGDAAGFGRIAPEINAPAHPFEASGGPAIAEPTGDPRVKVDDQGNPVYGRVTNAPQVDTSGELGLVRTGDPITNYLANHVYEFGVKVGQMFSHSTIGMAREKIRQETAANLDELRPEDILGKLEEAHFPHGYNRHISDRANRVLATKFMKGENVGKSYGEVLDAYSERMKRGLDIINNSSAKFSPDAPLSQKQSIFTDKDAKWALKELEKHGMDPYAADPHAAAFAHIQKQLAQDFDQDISKMTPYKTLQAAWGQQALISPRYHASNIIGSWMQNLMAGHSIRDTMNPAEYWRFIKAALKGEGGDLTAENMGGTRVADELRANAYSDLPSQVMRNNSTEGATGVSNKNSLGKVTSKVLGKRIGGVVGKLADANSAISSAWETNVRSALMIDRFSNAMKINMRAFDNAVREAAAKKGLEMPQMNVRAAEGGILTMDMMHGKLRAMGFTDGEAQHFTRQFLNLRNKAMDGALKEVNRVHFDYKFTNLDEAVSKVIPFHYWASRALRFYTEEAVRHPWYIMQYAKLREGMDSMYNDPGLSARSKGFMNLMDGPTGFTLMMNPESLLGVVKMFGMDSGNTPTGETEIGKLVRIGKQHGVGLFPWIDSMLNYMGAYGDTFAPDPAGLRTRQLVGAAVNSMRAHTGMDPAPAPYEASNVKLRDWISSLTSSLEPGWFSHVAQKSSPDGTLGRATLDDIITSRITAENPNITNQELVDILNNPDSPEYDKAYQEAADAGLINQILNFSMPTTFKVRERSRDVERAQINTIRDAAKKAGVKPQDYVPTMGDAEFATTYKNQTGKDWKPGDYDKAQFNRDMASATPRAQPFVIQSHEYNAIPSPEVQSVLTQSAKIRSGEWLPPELAGQNIPPDQLGNVADYYEAAHDGNGEVSQARAVQKAYRATHPEFDAWKSWQGQMYNITASYGTNGMSLYRTTVSASNPNAKRYFDQMQADVVKQNPNASYDYLRKIIDQRTTSADAWMAVTGQGGPTQYDPVALPGGGMPFDPATTAVQAAAAQPQYGNSGGGQQQTGWQSAAMSWLR
jgi:hypothetical protein